MVTLTLPSNRGLPFMGRTNTPRRRKQPVHYNRKFYRVGHKIETLFPRLKDWRPNSNPLRLLRPRLLLCHSY